MRTAYILLPFFLFSPTYGQIHPLDDDHRAILIARDSRDGGEIARFLGSPSEEVRASAAIAAGSLQDTSLISILSRLLIEESSRVKRAAAFALGQMTSALTVGQRAEISRTLLSGLGSTKGKDALLEIIEALGKAGDEASLSELVAFGEQSQDSEIQGEIALSVGRYGYRGLRNKAATLFIADLLVTIDQRYTWKTAYALRRIEVDSLLVPCESAMLATFSKGDPLSRMLLATALGSIHSAATAALLIEASKKDHDWRVRVNAVRALASSPARESTVRTLMELSRNSNEHVSLTALSSLGHIEYEQGDGEAIVNELLRIVKEESGITARQRDQAAQSIASIGRNDTREMLTALHLKGIISDAAFLRSLGSMSNNDAFVAILPFTALSDPMTQRIALEAAHSVVSADSFRTIKEKEARGLFVEALSSDDFAVLTVAASALGDSLLADASSTVPLLRRLADLGSAENSEAMIPLIQVLGDLKRGEAIPQLVELLQYHDRDVAFEAAQSLERITDRSYHGKISPDAGFAYKDYDWEFLESISQHPRVEVKTESGSFVFEMLTAEAPFTCLSFARLIRKGFYDGLSFHRVVPNFVIQGGDPHGDGWGGPGYSIRSEWGYEHYASGMVGVASAGKDTEGCQFFVTHSPQPHLDGRYTIFGRLVSGEEVVDRIQVGDRIVQMRFE